MSFTQYVAKGQGMNEWKRFVWRFKVSSSVVVKLVWFQNYET